MDRQRGEPGVDWTKITRLGLHQGLHFLMTFLGFCVLFYSLFFPLSFQEHPFLKWLIFNYLHQFSVFFSKYARRDSNPQPAD